MYLLYITEEACSNYMPFLKILARITYVTEWIITIIIPIILILIGIIKIIIAIKKKKTIKQAFIKLLKYIGIGFIMFFTVNFIHMITMSTMCDGYEGDHIDKLCCWKRAYIHRMYMEKEEVDTINDCREDKMNVIKIGKKIPKKIKQYNAFYDLNNEKDPEIIDKEFYLRHIIWDGKVKYSKIEFHTPSDIPEPGIPGTFDIDGKYKSEYKSNKDTLIMAFGNSNCQETKNSINCSFEGLYVSAYKNGYVEAENDVAKCYVTKDGTSCCNFY